LIDCKVDQEAKAQMVWLFKLEKDERKIDLAEDRFTEVLEELKQTVRDKGWYMANMMMKDVDKVFHLQKPNPGDAKVIFYPMYYVVFNGMKINMT
jgi:hypothetical protein